MPISYNKIKIPNGAIKLSPSGIAKFRKNPSEWLLDMKGKSTFTGNYSSILGTCIHYIFESNFDNRTESRYWEDVGVYLQEQVDFGVIEEYDVRNITEELKDYYPECNYWIDSDSMTVKESESECLYKLENVGETKNDYYLAGSIDAIVEDTEGLLGIRDYKSSKSKKGKIDTFLPQLLTYAIAYEKDIAFIEVVNIYKLKTRGVQFNVMRHYIDYERDIIPMLKYYKEIVRTHQTAKKYPQLEDMLFRKGTDFMGNALILQ